ncbi:MAG: hypothetical protein Q4C46_03915 [Bacillota bacterium]|nr:hypothetical protein [Bacillota bacterium]
MNVGKLQCIRKSIEGEYEIYDAELVISHDAGGKLYLYDIQEIKKDTAAVRVTLNKSHPAMLSGESRDAYNGTSDDNISQNNKNGNGKFSLKDSEVRAITQQQKNIQRILI